MPQPRLLQNQAKVTLDPYPHLKPGRVPKGEAGHYEVTRRSAHPNTSVNVVDMIAGQEAAPPSTTGQIPDMAGSRGFLDALSEQNRRQAEEISPEVMDAYRRGREKQMEIAQLRKDLDTPFETEEPPTWVSTSHSSHVHLLPAVDRRSLENLMTKPGHKQRANKTVQNGKTSTQYAGEYLARETAIQDVDALQSFHREALNSTKKATSKKHGWVGGAPSSTYRAMHMEFDVKECERQMDVTATNPVMHRSFAPTEEEGRMVEEAMHRRHSARSGDDGSHFTTTSAVSFTDRSKEGSKATYTRSHYFDKKNGTLQMPVRGATPLRKATNLHHVSTVSEVNPMQYTTTKQAIDTQAIYGIRA